MRATLERIRRVLLDATRRLRPAPRAVIEYGDRADLPALSHQRREEFAEAGVSPRGFLCVPSPLPLDLWEARALDSQPEEA